MEAEHILDAVMRFRRTGSVKHFLEMLYMIAVKRRCIEVLHGACSLVLRRPSTVSVSGSFSIEETLLKAGDIFRETHAAQIAAVRGAEQSLGIDDQLFFRHHCFCPVGKGFVVGEYAESNPRLIVSHGDSITLYHPYHGDRGVRHIHTVLEHEGTVFVTVGDSNKYLDSYRFRNGALRFERRVMRHLGGFSSACILGGDCWFGSDFTGRPNYLFNLRTGRKYYFPQPAYVQFSELMIPIDNRFLVCLNLDLTNKRTLSVFDVRTSAFEFCEARPPNFYF